MGWGAVEGLGAGLMGWAAHSGGAKLVQVAQPAGLAAAAEDVELVADGGRAVEGARAGRRASLRLHARPRLRGRVERPQVIERRLVHLDAGPSAKDHELSVADHHLRVRDARGRRLRALLDRAPCARRLQREHMHRHADRHTRLGLAAEDVQLVGDRTDAVRRACARRGARAHEGREASDQAARHLGVFNPEDLVAGRHLRPCLRALT